jgi:hypothetical protein
VISLSGLNKFAADGWGSEEEDGVSRSINEDELQTSNDDEHESESGLNESQSTNNEEESDAGMESDSTSESEGSDLVGEQESEVMLEHQ